MLTTQSLLDRMSHGFEGGTLEFSAPQGRRWTLGHGEPRAVLQLHSPQVLRSILSRPGLKFGEAYMDGRWQPVQGGLKRVLEVAIKIEEALDRRQSWPWLKRGLGKLMELNVPRISRRHVEHHYNLDATLYRRFLDAEMFYSCAYFENPQMTLEQAQQTKCALIARKLDLKPGARVLDIGCGWGGLAMYLAQHHGVQVTGITLSSEQLAVALQRVADRGLQTQVQLQLQDYRDMQGRFDAIVSVGMFEHVGRPQYPVFFRRIAELLDEQGSALLHTIGRLGPPGVTNPWIRKYIFPGGYIPAASEVLQAMQPQPLLLNDLEIWRLHYALTLQHWQQRFQQARAEFAQRLGERFCRMWEFYLQSSEAAFRWGNLCVFQLQLSKNLQRLPTTRDYLYPGRQTEPANVSTLPDEFPTMRAPVVM